jgi:hypothetical protein
MLVKWYNYQARYEYIFLHYTESTFVYIYGRLFKKQFGNSIIQEPFLPAHC